MERERLGHNGVEPSRTLPLVQLVDVGVLFDPQSESHLHRYLTEMIRAPQCVGDQRHAVAALIGRWGVVGDPTDSVVVAISELLSNAVLYGDTDTIGLYVAYDSFQGEVRIAVNDHTPGRRAEPCRPGDRVCGRGLLLVDALADAWGDSEDGCTTWCRIDVGSGGSR